MSSFSITRKKTPFQKHRAEEEARKKKVPSCLCLSQFSSDEQSLIKSMMMFQKEENETARLYQEFVESFQGDYATKTFVRGGTMFYTNDKFVCWVSVSTGIFYSYLNLCTVFSRQCFLICVLDLYFEMWSLCSTRLMKTFFCALFEDLGP